MRASSHGSVKPLPLRHAAGTAARYCRAPRRPSPSKIGRRGTVAAPLANSSQLSASRLINALSELDERLASPTFASGLPRYKQEEGGIKKIGFALTARATSVLAIYPNRIGIGS